jgi:hypothetical protein
MKTMRMALRSILLGTVVVATTAVGTGQANAINRVYPCNNDIYQNTNALHIASNSSTCWYNAGTASVVLYNASGLNSNNTGGYIQGKNQGSGSTTVHTFYFNKWVVMNFGASGYPLQQISTVHIN